MKFGFVQALRWPFGPLLEAPHPRHQENQGGGDHQGEPGNLGEAAAQGTGPRPDARTGKTVVYFQNKVYHGRISNRS